MSGIAVQFGAGNIGRGFLGQLYCESGLPIVFVDVAESLLKALNSRHTYEIEIVGAGACRIPITNVSGISSLDREAVAEAVSQAEVISTAVGANVLPKLAGNLAAGLIRRLERGAPPINIILCENLFDAENVIRNAVEQELPPDLREKVLEQTGFSLAVVSRMVPASTAAESAHDPLAIRVEAYNRLPIDASKLVGTLPKLVGFEPVANFAAHEARKLYTHNCAHAALGYLGSREGIQYGWQALEHSEIRQVLDQAMHETGAALIRKFKFSPEEQAAHVQDLLTRFANRALGDTCRRIARDPIRKLAPGDRLTGAARLCEEQGIAPDAVAIIMAAALRYQDPEDPSAAALQAYLAKEGWDQTVSHFCQIEPNEPLAARIIAGRNS